ncbi:hypothetical protein ATOBIA_N01620 [Atopobiaceae bacterium P1]|nr:hypothetical protein ATOBIA_N01620 [Atopobiaceae bacterium P1]
MAALKHIASHKIGNGAPKSCARYSHELAEFTLGREAIAWAKPTRGDEPTNALRGTILGGYG